MKERNSLFVSCHLRCFSSLLLYKIVFGLFLFCSGTTSTKPSVYHMHELRSSSHSTVILHCENSIENYCLRCHCGTICARSRVFYNCRHLWLISSDTGDLCCVQYFSRVETSFFNHQAGFYLLKVLVFSTLFMVIRLVSRRSTRCFLRPFKLDGIKKAASGGPHIVSIMLLNLI